MSFSSKTLPLLIVAGMATAHGYQASPRPAGRPWPPALETITSQSAPLSAADEMKTFVMPPGYRVELVASEPLIQDPILIDWDVRGRLWAIEMPSYMRDMVGSDEKSPTGRIVVLEDTNGDGVMDKRTVFADGLVLPRALKVLEHGVLVGEPPNLWLMHDTNGDLKVDSKELVTNQFGRADANLEHNANGLLWALDNWMYTSETDVYLRFKNGKFETAKTLSRGQWGGSQDDAGRIYRNTNESVLHVDVVPTPYYARNPYMLRTRGSYESLEGDNREVNTVWPARATPGVNRGYQEGILRSDGSLAAYTSANSPLVYRGDRLPRELYGNVFIAEPAANLIGRVIVEDAGASFEARRAYPKGEFLASTDERFRPVYLSNAPDGTIYIVDMYRGIIEHRGYITEYLRDQIVARKLEQPTGLGRIYRVMHDTTRRDTAPPFEADPFLARLVAALSHPNGWWRDTAQRLLVERGDKAVVPDLAALADHAPEVRTRLQALWTLDALDSLEPALVVKALSDPSRDVRVAGLRLAERWLPLADPVVQPAVIACLDDQDWAVQAQLAATVGAMRMPGRENAIAILLEKHGDDPITLDSAISSARGIELGVIDRLMSIPGESPEASAAITTLAAVVVRSGDEQANQKLFAWIAESARPEWQRSALLHGSESALLSVALPGSATATRNPAQAPCPTCPGARGGPGGARAFPNAEPQGASGRASGPLLKLAAPPSAMVTMASGSGALPSRAAKVLSRVEWPGKPGVATAAPLTAQEQDRLKAGEEIYKSVCQACHQADGRGQEHLGANLVGSAFATGSAEIAAKIVLNGKEGPVGLMPPLGVTLTDDQLAAALTFIRRSWGNAASAVDPATIKQVRAQNAGRTRPWTEAELGR
jgi:mono/diheme cytochrome c family protein/glucose/arabinose dehydrogenase